MRTVTRRITKLEDRFGLADGKPRFLVVLTQAGKKLALDADRCVQILDECGFLPTFGLVNLGEIPDDLDAKETERFLRANGAEICGFEDRAADASRR